MHGYNYSKREPVDPTAVMGVRTYAQMGSKWIKKLNSENMQKEQFSEWGGEENGAMLTTCLFIYSSECTIS